MVDDNVQLLPEIAFKALLATFPARQCLAFANDAGFVLGYRLDSSTVLLVNKRQILRCFKKLDTAYSVALKLGADRLLVNKMDVPLIGSNALDSSSKLSTTTEPHGECL